MFLNVNLKIQILQYASMKANGNVPRNFQNLKDETHHFYSVGGYYVVEMMIQCYFVQKRNSLVMYFHTSSRVPVHSTQLLWVSTGQTPFHQK